MHNNQFFEQLLSIRRPWYISEVHLDEEKKRVDIYIKHEPSQKFICPSCNQEHSVYDHCEEQEFQHLNVCQMQTYIHIRFPRLRCERNHKVYRIDLDIAEPRAKMTYEYENFMIHLIEECSLEAVRRLTGNSWDICFGVMERSVMRGQKRKERKLPQRLSIDEKSFAKGHQYESIICNQDKGIVEFVSDHREKESLMQYYRQFSEEERNQVESISMDMWDPYIAATREMIPGAEEKIVFDRFHIMRIVNKAVDEVRKKENRQLIQNNIHVLKNTKYLWLWNEENVPEFRKEEFIQLKSMDLKVCRAWAIKENLRRLWDYQYPACSKNFFMRWYFWASHSRIPAIIKSAKTLKKYLANILTYTKHKVTNAVAESLNSKIEKVKRLACGFRNRNNYKTAIYFHCGGLDLYIKPAKAIIRNWNYEPQYVVGTH